MTKEEWEEKQKPIREKCKQNKHQVIMTFPTEDHLKKFLAWFCDGGGEQQICYDPSDKNDIFHNISFDYSRCFPAWGWKEGDPKFIDAWECDDE